MNIGADVVFCGLAFALFIVGVMCWAKGVINASRGKKK